LVALVAKKNFKSGDPCEAGALARASEDAALLIENLFRGLDAAELVASSVVTKVRKELNHHLTVKLTEKTVGELATKERVPYDVHMDKSVGITFSSHGGSVVLEMRGLYFAPLKDAKDIFLEVMTFKADAKLQEPCKIECPNASMSDTDSITEEVMCESCVAYEWYRANKENLIARGGKMSKMLAGIPFDKKAFGVESKQGAHHPDEKRRRIIYSMLTVEPLRIKKVMFGSSSEDFGVPAHVNDLSTYATGGRYISVETEGDVRDLGLAAMSKTHNISRKSLSLGKTTWKIAFEQPADIELSTSDSFARMIASGRHDLHDHNIFVRPATSTDVIPVLGICAAAQTQLQFTEHPWKMDADNGCPPPDGKMIWRSSHDAAD
jgi:hypothetical protein